MNKVSMLFRLNKVSEVLHQSSSYRVDYRGKVSVGVDLGTAYLVLIVLDKDLHPIAGTYQFAQVVRDGVVVDYVGAVDRLKQMKTQVEAQLGFSLTQAATAHPPGIHTAEIRSIENVLYGADLACIGSIDEPSAANKVLQIEDGAVVDIGGGTTGIAIVKAGQVVYTADEPTGGTHFSLVIAGAKDISFEEAEQLKRDTTKHTHLFPIIQPVMEKVATIIQTHIAGYTIDKLYLVGGSSQFEQFASVVETATGITTTVPEQALFVTPLGIALQDTV
ncbi:MAG: ethanolamine utilization protein EutJ [Chloroflexota bacterium]